MKAFAPYTLILKTRRTGCDPVLFTFTFFHFLHIILTEHPDGGQKMKCTAKLLGYIILAFGAGILLTYFLPAFILVIIESAIIIGAGILWLNNR